MMFAVIAPALITGAFAERKRFGASSGIQEIGSPKIALSSRPGTRAGADASESAT